MRKISFDLGTLNLIFLFKFVWIKRISYKSKVHQENVRNEM